MLNAYKYRLHPTREQSEFFNKSFGCVRFIYNWGLQKRIEAYAKDKGRISYVQLCAMLTELKKEEQYFTHPILGSLILLLSWST